MPNLHFMSINKLVEIIFINFMLYTNNYVDNVEKECMILTE